MSRSHLQGLATVLGLCTLLISATVVSDFARPDGLRRYAPKATTPDEFARFSLTFVLIPATRKAVDRLPEAERQEAASKLTLWSKQVFDAILDYESHSAVTLQDALGYMKSKGYSDAAIGTFNKAMAKADPSNKDAYQQTIADAVLDAIARRDVERGGPNVRTGNPEIVLGALRNWSAAQTGQGGEAKLTELFGPGQPIKFPREPYIFARDFLRAGNYWFEPSQYTEEAEKLSNPLPVGETSSPGFPLDAYTDRRLMKQIYEHDFNEHSGGIDPIYAQEFFAQLKRDDACPELNLNAAAATKVTVLAEARLMKTDLGLDKPDLLEAARSHREMSKPGVSLNTWVGNYSHQMALSFRGEADAREMIKQYGCKSPIVSRFLANMSDWILLD